MEIGKFYREIRLTDWKILSIMRMQSYELRYEN